MPRIWKTFYLYSFLYFYVLFYLFFKSKQFTERKPIKSLEWGKRGTQLQNVEHL